MLESRTARMEVPAISAVLSFTLAWLSFALSDATGVATIWLPTAVACALLARAPENLGRAAVLVGWFIGNVSAFAVHEHTTPARLLHASIEVATILATTTLGAELARRSRATSDLREPLAMISAFLICTALSAALSAVVFHGVDPPSRLLERALTSWTSTAFGMLFVAPLALFSREGAWRALLRQRPLAEVLGALVLMLSTSAWAVQKSRPYIYSVTVLAVGAFFMPPLGTALLTTLTIAFLLCAPYLLDLSAAINPADDMFAMVLVMAAPTCVAALLRARERAQEELHAVSTFRNVIIQAAGYPIICTNRSGLVTLFNPAAERLFGYKAEELVGKQTTEILRETEQIASTAVDIGLPPETSYAELLSRLETSQDVVIRKWMYRRKDGSLFPGLSSIAVLRDAQGEVTGFIGMLIDLSELERAHRLFDQAINDVGVPVLLAGPDLAIVRANRAAHNLLEEVDGALLHRKLDAVLAHDAQPERRALDLRDQIERGRPRCTIGEGQEMLIRRRDGRAISVEVGWSAIETPDGQSLLAVVMVDITLRKQFEAALESRSAALRQAKEAAEEASRTRTRVFAQVSHELRTPMNVVLGMTHLARQQACPPAVSEYLDKIERSAQDLLEILNDVLDFSKIDAGRMGLEVAPFGLMEVIGAMSSLVDGLKPSANLEFEIKHDPALPDYLLGDRTRLQQVLTNLLNNAVKFTSQGKVEFEITQQQRTAQGVVLRFVVRDSGIGMSKAQLERLFQPFTQGDSSITRRYGGSGLGLAITRRLVELMGGQIEVESKLGRGTTFVVTLPFGVTDVRPEREPNVADNARTSGLLRGLRVLVVEDHVLNQEVARGFLQSLGIEASLAQNGQEAVEMVRASQFDLVLMDLQMPVMDGLEATRAIRNMYGKTQLPIIAMSADVFREDRNASYAAGMNDHVGKPFRPEELIATLAYWSGRSKSSPPPSAPPEWQERPSSDDLPLLSDEPTLLTRDRTNHAQLLELFVSEHEHSTRELSVPRSEQAGAALRDLAHRLKSEAPALGLLRLGAAAAALDRALRAHSLDVEPQIERLQAVMDATLQQVQAALRERQSWPAPARRTAPSDSPDAILASVRAVCSQLEANKLDAIRALEALRLQLAGTPSEAAITQANGAARQLKFREAKALMQTVAFSLAAGRGTGEIDATSASQNSGGG